MFDLGWSEFLIIGFVPDDGCRPERPARSIADILKAYLSGTLDGA